MTTVNLDGRLLELADVLEDMERALRPTAVLEPGGVGPACKAGVRLRLARLALTAPSDQLSLEALARQLQIKVDRARTAPTGEPDEG